MTTEKVFDGKSYADNPHVRLDERKSVPVATPGRGSSLYKKLLMSLAVCMAVPLAWGKSFSIDLRQPAAGDGARVRAQFRSAPAAADESGCLRRVNLDAGSADVGQVAVGDELAFTLFDNVSITLTLKKRMPSPLGGDVFLAEASGYEGVKNAVVMRMADGLTVDIQDYVNKRVYKVISTATGVAVQELEARAGKCGCDTRVPPKQDGKATAKARKAKKVVAAKDAEHVETYVDILVAYDQNAATWAKSNGGGVTNFAQMSVQKMNTALANNGLDVNFRFRLVGVLETSASSADLNYALDSVTDGAGDWASIKKMRDEVGADIVTVLIDTGTGYGTTGLGWSLETTDFESFSESAYNVCAIRSVAQSHTMTHEVGHNMGCGHSDQMADKANCGPQLYDYSAGYYLTELFPKEEGSESFSQKRLHTVMAYDEDGYGDFYDEIPYFSSSERTYTLNGKSVVVGDATHDNARTLKNTYAAVANWRTQKVPITYDVQFNPVSGTIFDGSISVTLTSTWASAEIRYTLDGSVPNADSIPYSGAITLTDSATIRAVTIVDGVCGFPFEAKYTKSTLASAIGGGLEWTFSDNLPWSVYDLPDSEEYVLPEYPSPDGLCIRAVRSASGDAKTAWLEAEITGPCDISFFDLGAGGITISVLVDGELPDAYEPGSQQSYFSYGSCHWGAPAVVKVPSGQHKVRLEVEFWAEDSGWGWNYVEDGMQYVILDGFTVHRVPAPVLAPATAEERDDVDVATFEKEQMVAISSASDTALIYYTLDGNDPGGEKGILYDGPLFINKTTTVKAIAMEPGQEPSSVVTTGVYLERTLPKPGEWTGNAEGAFAAAAEDGRMVAILCMNYSGCMWSQALEPVLRNASFLSWARANGVYLVNTDSGWLDGEAASTSCFWNLYNGSPLAAELGGSVYYPTFCFASPADKNVCLGTMLARNDGMHKVNGIAYDDTPESLIACFASILGKSPLGAPVANVTGNQVMLANANGTGTIYYTLDGTAPTREHGTVYGGAITVPLGATLQAVVWPEDADGVSGIPFGYANLSLETKMGVPGMTWQNDVQEPWKLEDGHASISATNVSKLVAHVSSPGIIDFVTGYCYGGILEFSIDGTVVEECGAWGRFTYEITNAVGGELVWTFKPYEWAYEPEANIAELTWLTSPSAPAVRAEGGDRVNGALLRWNGVNGATKYIVYRADVNDPALAVKVGETTQPRYWDADSGNGTTHWYWVKTVNNYGESDFSEGVQAVGQSGGTDNGGSSGGTDNGGSSGGTDNGGSGGGTDNGGSGGGDSVTPQPSDPAEYILHDAVGGVVSAWATVYDGCLYRNGSLAGTIQVKVGKPNANTGLAAVKATVIGTDGTKKTLKAAGNGKAKIDGDGPTTVSFVGGDACVVTLGAKGMSGTYGGSTIDGSLNVFTSKDASDKAAASAALGKWQGVVNVAWKNALAARPEAAPYHTLSMTIAAKGKAKVAGTLADGAKVSANGQLIVGEEWCCVPVVCAKKGVNLCFAVWLPLDGAAAGTAAPHTAVVVGLADAIVGKPGTLKAGAAFRIDAAALGSVLGQAVLPYLPDGVAVTGGAKWTLPKAGKVMYAKGTTTVDETKAGENPSGLKLTYKAKDGTFKGSFKAYADVGGKPKATTVNVTGVLVGGVGYGAAMVKKVGGVSVTISPR